MFERQAEYNMYTYLILRMKLVSKLVKVMDRDQAFLLLCIT